MLRRGWPERILNGRYSFATYQRDSTAQRLIDWADLLTDGLIERRPKHELHLRIDGQTVMIVLTGRYPHLPPGIKICGGSPAAPLLVLCPRRERRPRRERLPRRERRPRLTAALFAPTYYDVVDHRLGATIGVLETSGGFVRPARTVIYDSSQRVVGRLVQPLAALLGCWLLVGRDRHDVIVDGLRVARIDGARAMWSGELQVDVTGAAGLVDPRLILACAVQKVYAKSDY